jgi:hypothetical protein
VVWREGRKVGALAPNRANQWEFVAMIVGAER